MPNTLSRARRLLASLAMLGTAFAALVVAGCAAPQATSSNTELAFKAAVVQATDGLMTQTKTLPGFLAKVESKLAKRGVVLEPMLDASSGQQTSDVLSNQRAAYIRQRLATEAAPLGAPAKTSGVGSRENIVGSGTDNAVDALDRRVEFKIVPCG